MRQADDKVLLEELGSRWEVLVEALADNAANSTLLTEVQWVGNEILAVCSHLDISPLWFPLSHLKIQPPREHCQVHANVLETRFSALLRSRTRWRTTHRTAPRLPPHPCRNASPAAAQRPAGRFRGLVKRSPPHR